MAELSKNGKYLNLEGFRVNYRKQDNTIHLTSTDPDFIEGFHLTLKDGSPTEKALREILTENGLISDETLSLPTEAVFEDSVDSEPHVFPLGLGYGDKPVVWDSEKDSNILFAGRAGSGKSVGIRGIIEHCAKYDAEWEIYGIDYKKVELHTYFQSSPNFVGLNIDLNESLSFLRGIYERMMDTYERMRASKVNKASQLENPPKSVMLVVDEAGLFFAPKTGLSSYELALHQERVDLLKQIVRTGRAAGVHVVISTQSVTADTVPADVRNNLSARVVFGRAQSMASYIALDSGEATKVDGQVKGRAVARLNGVINHFQSYFFPSPKNTYLPESVSLNSKQFKDPYSVPLGVTYGSKPVLWEMKLNSNLLISGKPGAGKSTKIHSILKYCSLKKNLWEVHLIDIDQNGAKYNEYEPSNFSSVSDSVQSALTTLSKVSEEISDRYALMEKEGVSNFSKLRNAPKPILLIVDETGSLFGWEPNPRGLKLTTGVKELANIMRLGRAAGIYVILSASNPVSSLPSELTPQLNVKMILGDVNPEISQHLLGTMDGTKVENVRGRGVMSLNGQIIHFQGYKKEA